MAAKHAMKINNNQVREKVSGTFKSLRAV